MAKNDKDDTAEAAAAGAAAGAMAQQATQDAERLKREAAAHEAEYQKAGKVMFEYSVRETTQDSDVISKDQLGNPSYGGHRLVHKDKGSREALPRPIALRKQAQGLGRIIGEDNPYEINTMRDVVIRDPLAPRPEDTGRGSGR